VLCVITAAMSFETTYGQTDWKLDKDQDGIKVYSRALKDSKFKSLMVTCKINCTPAELTSVIMDVENSCKWVYRTQNCKLLKRLSPNELYYYAEVSVPWPANNRDYVVHITSARPDEHTTIIKSNCVAGWIPENRNKVRIVNSSGVWRIEDQKNNLLNVTYTTDIDPGGSVPAWLINLFAAQGPLESFKKLRLEVKNPHTSR
jgi:hypothetical protein